MPRQTFHTCGFAHHKQFAVLLAFLLISSVLENDAAFEPDHEAMMDELGSIKGLIQQWKQHHVFNHYHFDRQRHTDRKTSWKGSEYKRGYFAGFKDWVLNYAQHRLATHYGPKEENPINMMNSTWHDLLCELKKHPLRILTTDSYPFNKNPLTKKVLPHEDTVLDKFKFGACALVSSSGRLLKSRKGPIIDTFDQVCRLNDAPTMGFEMDVGSKTTVRMLNNFQLSQLPKDKDPESPAHFPTDDKDVLLFGWDVCPVRVPFHQCLAHIDEERIHKVEPEDDHIHWSFFRWRQKNMDKKFYFLHPYWIYSLTDFLTKLSPIKLDQHTVPSTGFIGFAVMANLCSELHLFEMIPTDVQGMPCKYFFTEPGKEWNMNCSLFDGHHREMEVIALAKLNTASDEETYGRGHAVIKGLSSITC